MIRSAPDLLLTRSASVSAQFNKKDRGDRSKNYKQKVVPGKPKKANNKAGAMLLKTKSDSSKCGFLAKNDRWKGMAFDFTPGGNCNGNPNQQLYMVKVEGKSVFKIKAASSDKCLDYNFNNGELYFHNCHIGTNQEFFWDAGNLDAPTYKNGAKNLCTAYKDDKWGGFWPFRFKIPNWKIHKCMDYTGSSAPLTHRRPRWCPPRPDPRARVCGGERHRAHDARVPHRRQPEVLL